MSSDNLDDPLAPEGQTEDLQRSQFEAAAGDEGAEGATRAERAESSDPLNEAFRDLDALNASALADRNAATRSSSRPSTSNAQSNRVRWLDDTEPDNTNASSSVLVPRNVRGTKGTRDYDSNLRGATAAIDTPLGVPKHFVSAKDGEVESGDQKNHQYIQETFVGNLEKVDAVAKRLTKYDMRYLFRVPRLLDEHAGSASRMFSSNPDDDVDLLVHWDKITSFKHVCLYQQMINKRLPDVDKDTNAWALAFFENSSTAELKRRISNQLDRLPEEYQGSVTYLYAALRFMFWMSRETIDAMKAYLKIFKDKGLRRFRGENVTTAEREVVAVCTRLDEADALPNETVIDVLEGLTLCSVEKFVETFNLILQMERVTALNVNPNLDESDLDDLMMSGIAPAAANGNTLVRLKHYFSKAVDLYHSLNTSNLWHVGNSRRGGASAAHSSFAWEIGDCYNCGGKDHRATNCPKPRNQAVYDANKRRHEQLRSENRGGNSGRSGRPGGPSGRKKWEPPTATPSKAPSGAMIINGVPHASCKECGWNTTHSTKYHAMAVAAGSAFKLADVCPRHPLVQLQQQGKGDDQKPAPKNGANGVYIDSAQACSVLDNLERNSPSADTADAVSALRKLFQIN